MAALCGVGMHQGTLESARNAVLGQETMEQAKHRGGLYSMPRPFGKPCAAALDGIVPQPHQRQGEAAKLKPASQQPHELFKQSYPALAGGCRAESSAVWAEAICAENINAGKKRAGLRRPFVVEVCGVLYGRYITVGAPPLNVAVPV